MGAWIETLHLKQPLNQSTVAPRVGAWIETLVGCLHPVKIESHPAWVRGLKHYNPENVGSALGVAPRVGAWIETFARTAAILHG